MLAGELGDAVVPVYAQAVGNAGMHAQPKMPAPMKSAAANAAAAARAARREAKLQKGQVIAKHDRPPPAPVPDAEAMNAAAAAAAVAAGSDSQKTFAAAAAAAAALAADEENAAKAAREEGDDGGDKSLAANGGVSKPGVRTDEKRLKRLLRNRVSAQQARERKKNYVQGLEDRAIVAERAAAELQEQVQTLQRENQMLRQIIKSTRMSG